MSRPVLAVDFGTSNSYFCKCPPDELLPSPVDFMSDRTGMDTAILYRRGRRPLVGSIALHTWGEATETERNAYSLVTRFKPEVGTRDEAYSAARDFLMTVREEAAERHIAFDPEKRDVYFGIPCQASPVYVERLKKVALEAGYGTIKTVEEPLGALLYHLSQRDMAPSEAMGRVMVLDFGGGTCDAALLEGLSVVRAWGDWALGGRLFDDLFFRILSERNPDLSRGAMDEGTEYFVRWYWSRVLKESFSTTMARDRREPWSGTAGVYGSIRHLGWNEFMKMASSYIPSKEILDSVGPDCPGRTGPEDLIGRLSRVVSLGKDADIVILAGGSSLWPFVADLVTELLPGARLIRSDQPYGVVARGLALLPALKLRNERSIDALSSDVHRFIEEIRLDVVDRALSGAVEDASAELATLLVGEIVAPALEDYRKKGGSASALRDKIAEEMASRKPRVDGVLRGHMERAAGRIPAMVVEKMARWFRDKGVKSLPGHVELALCGHGPDLFGSIDVDSLSPLKGLMDSADRIVAVVAGVVAASFCGGGGLALVASGLPGLVLGGALGLGGYLAGRKSLRKGLEELPVPGMFSRVMLSERALEKTLQRVAKALSEGVNESVRENWRSMEPELVESIRDLVKKEIRALSLVNQIEGGRIDGSR